MNFVFRKAAEEDIPEIFALYEKRIAWMEEKGLRQWNATDYLTVYPRSYFQTQAAEGRLYGAEDRETGEILGAVVLLSQDDRWADRAGEPAYYVHNLVTDAAAPGVGGWMLGEMEIFARKAGKTALRLDCAVDNAVLNDYYASHGYREAGCCADGAYRGIRREKRV